MKRSKKTYAAISLILLVGILTGVFFYISRSNKITATNGIVNVDTLYVREAPEENAAVVTILPLGAKVQIEDEANEFYHVKFMDGEEGYVMAEFIDK